MESLWEFSWMPRQTQHPRCCAAELQCPFFAWCSSSANPFAFKFLHQNKYLFLDYEPLFVVNLTSCLCFLASLGSPLSFLSPLMCVCPRFLCTISELQTKIFLPRSYDPSANRCPVLMLYSSKTSSRALLVPSGAVWCGCSSWSLLSPRSWHKVQSVSGQKGQDLLWVIQNDYYRDRAAALAT